MGLFNMKPNRNFITFAHPNQMLCVNLVSVSQMNLRILCVIYYINVVFGWGNRLVHLFRKFENF